MPDARISVGLVVKPLISGSLARRRMPGTSAPSAKMATRCGRYGAEALPAEGRLAVVATAVGDRAAQGRGMDEQRGPEGHEAGHHQEQAGDGEVHTVRPAERQ